MRRLFVWAARRGQFDDLETPGLRMLHDDEPLRRRAGRIDPEPDDEDEEAGTEGSDGGPPDDHDTRSSPRSTG